MKKAGRCFLVLALVVVAVLLLASVPIWAGGNSVPAKSLAEAREALQRELLPVPEVGFVGIAHSEAEGEVVVFVADEQAGRQVPRSVAGYRVRVEVIGTIEALSAQVTEPVPSVSDQRKEGVRPLAGGTSLSAYVTKGALIYSYAGTLGMVTYDGRILSNAHVIAMHPQTQEYLGTGTAIIQPGSGDGGRLGDRVGGLEAYIPIDFGPDAQNYADAATSTIDTGVSASAGKQFAESGSYWIEGWTAVSKGDTVRKSGRTTGVTTGQVTHTNASVWVTYGDQTAFFADQIVVAQDDWSFAAQGDSGSAVDKGGEFVGLVFGGSPTHAVICKAEHIIEALGIAVEQVEGFYSLNVSSTAGGSVIEPGEGSFTYEAEAEVGLVAEPDDHFRFVRWTGDVDTIDDVYSAGTTITMMDSYSVTAVFELEEGLSSLTVSSTVGGTVTDPGEGMFVYDVGTVVDLVSEAHEHYRFVEWSGDVDRVGNVYDAATNITMDGSYAISAIFEVEEGFYSLNLSSTPGGQVTEPGEGIFIYEAGAVVDLAAGPEEDFLFLKWTGDVEAVGDVHAPGTNVTMHGSYSITASFEPVQPPPSVLLTVSSTSGGRVTSPGEGGFFSPLGTEVELVAQPAAGHRFVGWSGDVDTIADVKAASTTITMDSSYSIIASFALSGCFIATAAYGTPLAHEIQILRDFRDGYLVTNRPGQAFVDFYYRISPPIAQFIAGYPVLRAIVRVGLLPALAVATLVIGGTSVDLLAMVGLLALATAAVAVWSVRRRARGVTSASHWVKTRR